MNTRIDLASPSFPPDFMSVHEVANYLQINEKKIYALLKSGDIPGTKVTGKWLFPKELIDRWVLDSSHGGLMQDRLLICGGDDPLLYRLALELGQQYAAHALVSYCPGGTRLGLDLLQNGRADVCALHWGPARESATRHPALIRACSRHRHWILLRLFNREMGVLLNPARGISQGSIKDLLTDRSSTPLRWCLRQPGSGAQRYFEEALGGLVNHEDLNKLSQPALTERQAAASITAGRADCAPGCRATATEFGLDFLPLGKEAFDLVLPNAIYFRKLFQQLLEKLQSASTRQLAAHLEGYDLSPAGQIIWNSG